ncbi:hypothetical protein [Bacteroides acidifaciens]|uniref:hypothetical protein n=2 Tax=Bacteroidales TaxID=171549 RepID=UPI002676F7C3|nr:hypothetical protein [Bacteroides acidifaciens]
MKKRMKNNLAQMAALLPELDAEHQRGILGGTAIPVTSPDYPEMIPVSTVVASTVVPCATPESTFLPTTTAFVPTPTASSVVTSIPVPTTTASPVETSTAVLTAFVPPVPTSSTLMSTTIPVISATSATTSTSGDSFGNFCTNVWDWGVECVESTVDGIVHVASEFPASVAESFAYMYLDFKYNGLDAGNGICNIPIEEYMRVRDEYHAYHFSFDKGIWREKSKLPENLTYSDMREIVDVITLPGFINVNSGYGKVMDYIIGYGVNKGIHYGIDQLLDLGEPQK